MKKILFSIIAICSSIVATAQNTDEPSAILQHGDQVSVYKGSTGLQNAYAAAVDGDVINLSAGTFQSVTIEKALTILGAGFENNAEVNTAVTYINGDWTVGENGAVIDGFYLEGVNISGKLVLNCELKNAQIQRCYINSALNFNYNIENVLLKQCRFGGEITGNWSKVANGLLISNCYVLGQIHNFAYESFVNIDHSIVATLYNDIYPGYAQFLWTNSILSANDTYRVQPVGDYSTVRNCIIVSGSGNVPGNAIAENCFYVDIANIFADGENITIDETRTFELKDPTTYVGTDGTPIGLSGGDGWNKVPSKPYVSNLSATPSGTNLNITYEAGVNK